MFVPRSVKVYVPGAVKVARVFLRFRRSMVTPEVGKTDQLSSVVPLVPLPSSLIVSSPLRQTR